MWSGCLNNALDGVAASSQENKTDVVLHFGMHGTVEWLPGSPLGNNGLSWSDVLMGCVIDTCYAPVLAVFVMFVVFVEFKLW